jgi:hypothetical protein
MDLVKWVFMTSVGTFVGNLGDQAIRASGNYLLENMHNFSVYEPNKWPYDPPCECGWVPPAHGAAAGEKHTNPSPLVCPLPKPPTSVLSCLSP